MWMCQRDFHFGIVAAHVTGGQIVVFVADVTEEFEWSAKAETVYVFIQGGKQVFVNGPEDLEVDCIAEVPVIHELLLYYVVNTNVLCDDMDRDPCTMIKICGYRRINPCGAMEANEFGVHLEDFGPATECMGSVQKTNECFSSDLFFG